jgi:hypothetical protein
LEKREAFFSLTEYIMQSLQLFVLENISRSAHSARIKHDGATEISKFKANHEQQKIEESKA